MVVVLYWGLVAGYGELGLGPECGIWVAGCWLESISVRFFFVPGSSFWFFLGSVLLRFNWFWFFSPLLLVLCFSVSCLEVPHDVLLSLLLLNAAVGCGMRQANSWAPDC